MALLWFVPLAGSFLAGLGAVAMLVANAFLPVAVLRASVYQRAGAGYRLEGVWDMFERDWRGAWRVAGIGIVGRIVISLVMGLITAPLFAGFLLSLTLLPFRPVEWVSGVLSAAAPALVLLAILYGIAQVVLDMLVYGAAGLFVRQFDVARWGRSEDPLPDERPRGVDGAESAREGDQTVPPDAGDDGDVPPARSLPAPEEPPAAPDEPPTA